MGNLSGKYIRVTKTEEGKRLIEVFHTRKVWDSSKKEHTTVDQCLYSYAVSPPFIEKNLVSVKRKYYVKDVRREDT